MASSDEDNGLLLVYGECGPHVTEDEFNDWYDNEHAPARIAVPGFSTTIRYKATDEKPPSWLAIYDIATPAVLQTETYKAIPGKVSDNERSIISRLGLLQRCIYERFLTVQKPGVEAGALPSQFLLVVGLECRPEQEDEITEWYKGEHLTLLSKVPGFLRARRFKLVSSTEMAGNTDPKLAPKVFPYVTLYDWETDAYPQEPTFKEAMTTPATVRVFETTTLDLKLFKLYKDFPKK